MARLKETREWEIFCMIIEAEEIEPLKDRLIAGQLSSDENRRYKSLEEMKYDQKLLNTLINLIYTPDEAIIHDEDESQIRAKKEAEEALNPKNDRS